MSGQTCAMRVTLTAQYGLSAVHLKRKGYEEQSDQTREIKMCFCEEAMIRPEVHPLCGERLADEECERSKSDENEK